MEIFRYFSIPAILVVWIFSGLVILKWFNSKSLSLSLHAAAFKKAYLFFATGLTLNAIFFYIFMRNWFIPQYNLSDSFMLLCIFTLFCQLIAAWVPDIKRKVFSNVHNVAAFTLAMCMPIILLFIINSSKVTPVTRLVAIIANLVMITELVILFFFNKKKSHYLIYQAVYASVFHITLLAITFLG